MWSHRAQCLGLTLASACGTGGTSAATDEESASSGDVTGSTAATDPFTSAVSTFRIVGTLEETTPQWSEVEWLMPSD